VLAGKKKEGGGRRSKGKQQEDEQGPFARDRAKGPCSSSCCFPLLLLPPPSFFFPANTQTDHHPVRFARTPKKRTVTACVSALYAQTDRPQPTPGQAAPCTPCAPRALARWHPGPPSPVRGHPPWPPGRPVPPAPGLDTQSQHQAPAVIHPPRSSKDAAAAANFTARSGAVRDRNRPTCPPSFNGAPQRNPTTSKDLHAHSHDARRRLQPQTTTGNHRCNALLLPD
jgi:hypothetical protein